MVASINWDAIDVTRPLVARGSFPFLGVPPMAEKSSLQRLCARNCSHVSVLVHWYSLGQNANPTFARTGVCNEQRISFLYIVVLPHQISNPFEPRVFVLICEILTRCRGLWGPLQPQTASPFTGWPHSTSKGKLPRSDLSAGKEKGCATSASKDLNVTSGNSTGHCGLKGGSHGQIELQNDQGTV